MRAYLYVPNVLSRRLVLDDVGIGEPEGLSNNAAALVEGGHVSISRL